MSETLHQNTSNHYQPRTEHSLVRSESHLELTPRGKVARALGGATLTALSLFGGVKAVEYLSQAPTYSEETATYSVEQGDGLWKVAHQIDGAERDMAGAVRHLENMPENAAVLDDGLQPGEIVVYPTSVER